ncbi:MAG: hypothetical protein LDL01_02940 [Ignavibacterium sp.]|jgi:hypothetical protein|uniref:Lipoprotein n=1 Tax=Ignavibacterium album TaxID=591197 RepID=A0A7V2ZM17_9BACT|nr:hypothetical protein [Ignavibacterium album]MCA2004729.1 hypothetical protein [Ignavibacterium sp.]MCX8104342.1 hypothetical protein [Ignavibacterium album]
MRIFIALIITLIISIGCSSLKLSPAEFDWPVESVQKIDNEGFVKEDRYSFSFNSKALFLEEMQDSMAYKGKDLRIIRNKDGYYFITTKGFKNVYIFQQGEASLELKEKLLVNENGLNNPFFNQRNPFVELVDGDIKVFLTSEGLQGGAK